MSRRHSAEKREILPDPKFGNVVVTKFMNSVMHAGKKSVAEGIVYGALEMIEGKTRGNPIGVFQQRIATPTATNRLIRWTPPIRMMPRRSASAVARTFTRESGSSTQSTGTS